MYFGGARDVTRANPSGLSLTETDAALVKGMLRRGDRQHDIAAWFGVNGGRIAEISTGVRFASATAAPDHMLPPRGPYISGRAAHAAVDALQNIRDVLEGATRECEKVLSKIEESKG